MEQAQGREVLVVTTRLCIAERVTRALSHLPWQVVTSFDQAEARAAALRRRFDGIVVAEDEPPVETAALTAAVRGEGSASRRAAVVVCCNVLAASAGVAAWPGANRAVLLCDIEDALPAALERLFQVAPRVRAVLPSRIEVPGPGFSRRFLCQTVNVSSSGMLLRVPHSLQPGTTLRFELFVSVESPPVQGRARVVRLARPDREPFPAVGVSFSLLDADDHARLVAHLQRMAA